LTKHEQQSLPPQLPPMLPLLHPAREHLLLNSLSPFIQDV